MSTTFILDGEPRLNTIINFLRALPLVVSGRRKRWRLTVTEYQAQRSDLQNNALWGVAYPPIMASSGLSGEDERAELHEYFCGEYFGWIERRILGRRKLKPKRTTTRDENGKRSVLTKMEFVNFYAFIQRRGAEYGIFVPDPDPFWFEKEDAANDTAPEAAAA